MLLTARTAHALLQKIEDYRFIQVELEALVSTFGKELNPQKYGVNALPDETATNVLEEKSNSLDARREV